MRRARRWYAAAVMSLLLAGCSSSSDVGGDAFTANDALWTGIYFGVLVLGVVAASMLVEANE